MDVWPVDELWPVFEMSTQRQLAFRVPASEVIPVQHPITALHVYDREEYEKCASREEKIPLLIAPNTVYVVIEGDCSDLRIPFFVSTGFPTRPAVYHARLRFQVAGIKELPDVIEYDERMEEQARTGDKYDRMLISPCPKGPIRIPVGCYLPGTLQAPNGAEATIVYAVDEWLEDRMANVVIHSSDASVMPTIGSSIMRRRCAPSGFVRECIVGTVVSEPNHG